MLLTVVLLAYPVTSSSSSIGLVMASTAAPSSVLMTSLPQIRTDDTFSRKNRINLIRSPLIRFQASHHQSCHCISSKR
jgi:hypothetical protein